MGISGGTISVLGVMNLLTKCGCIAVGLGY